jgi:hypothetical protein
MSSVSPIIDDDNLFSYFLIDGACSFAFIGSLEQIRISLAFYVCRFETFSCAIFLSIFSF